MKVLTVIFMCASPSSLRVSVAGVGQPRAEPASTPEPERQPKAPEPEPPKVVLPRYLQHLTKEPRIVKESSGPLRDYLTLFPEYLGACVPARPRDAGWRSSPVVLGRGPRGRAVLTAGVPPTGLRKHAPVGRLAHAVVSGAGV
jgi:hypothetical protein